MTSNQNLIDRRDRVVCRGVGRVSDVTASTASGAVITDVEGRPLIDFAGGIGVMNVGHCDPEVVAAIREQAGMLLHACFHVATYEAYVALCEKLVAILPHGPSTKAMLVNSGAEAVENSIKIARQATGRSAVICFTGGFHGRTLLATTLTSKINYKIGCGPFAPEVYRLPYPECSDFDGPAAACVAAGELARLRAAFGNTVAAENVAAIIIELVQGEGGFNVAPKPYVAGLREICDEQGIMLIIDEVQTGFGRTGRWGAFEHYSVVPDLSTWAKSMGGGLPISCVLGRGEIMDRVTPGTLGGTFGGNPVACAAALATIKRMESLRLNEVAAQCGATIRARFEALSTSVPEIVNVRGLGAMLAMEFAEEGDPGRPAGGLVRQIIRTCCEKGLLVISAGIDGNVIRVLAPLVIANDELERGLSILEDTIRDYTCGPAKAGVKGRK